MSSISSLHEICEEFKELLCLPRESLENLGKNFPNSSEIPPNSVSLYEYLKVVEEQNKEVSAFFKYEMMRLLIFRHLMCLKCNFNSNFRVVLSSGNSGEDLKNPLLISRLDYPISINEKNFCYNPDDEACRIPNTILKDWFNNSNELLYSVAKELLVGNGYNSEYEFKEDLIKHLKFKSYKYDGGVVIWINSIVEKCRIYIRL